MNVADLLDWRPPVRFMGQGVKQLRTPWVPRYREMLQHICETTKWNPEHFRGYRIEVEFPVTSWQISLAFDKHDPPTS